MARCKECLHYEVCAKEGQLVQVDEHTWDEYNKLDDVEQFCTNYFTADVVPKSEIEELIRENESLAKTVNEASELIRKLRSKVKKSKSDVAREIFEEIESTCEYYKYICEGTYAPELKDAIAELKKKYTEMSEEDTTNA